MGTVSLRAEMDRNIVTGTLPMVRRKYYLPNKSMCLQAVPDKFWLLKLTTKNMCLTDISRRALHGDISWLEVPRYAKVANATATASPSRLGIHIFASRSLWACLNFQARDLDGRG